MRYHQGAKFLLMLGGVWSAILRFCKIEQEIKVTLAIMFYEFREVVTGSSDHLVENTFPIALSFSAFTKVVAKHGMAIDWEGTPERQGKNKQDPDTWTLLYRISPSTIAPRQLHRSTSQSHRHLNTLPLSLDNQRTSPS